MRLKGKEAWIALNLIPGIGRSTFFRLLEYFEDPAEVFEASLEELSEVPRMNPGRAAKIKNFDQYAALERERDLLKKSGARVITIEDDEYPQSLKDIYDPPPLFYILGEFRPEDNISLSVIGSRKYTTYGRDVCKKMVRELVEIGFTIVSGMARGMDSVAHQAALGTGGRTVAFLGCGIDVVYPPENHALMKKIAGQGAVMSEFPLSIPPRAYNFPVRNRVVSGASLGTVVIEAGSRSGTSITVGCALEQGKEVFCVPGPITSPISKGTNRFIQTGAKLITRVEDILEEIRFEFSDVEERYNAWLKNNQVVPKPVKITAEQARILEIIQSEELHIDEIITRSGFMANRVLGILMLLENRGIVTQSPGKMFRKSLI